MTHLQRLVSSFGVLLLSAAGFWVRAQTAPLGGKKSFAFLNTPTSAKLAGTGGMNVSSGNDINVFLANPALLSQEVTNQASANYAPYYGDISLSQFAYGYSLKDKGNVALAVINQGYGTMDRTDAGGNRMGTFQANDFAIIGGYSRQKGDFTLGANAKYVGSQIDGFRAYALGIDLGAAWKHPKRDFRVGLAVKNIGLLDEGYTEGSSAEIPLNVQLGASYKLEHMPLRFTVTSHTLQTWDIVYLDPNKTVGLDQDGNPIRPSKTFGDKLMRHFTFGAELIFSKNFNLRAGYHHQMNRELRLEDASSGAGWSVGGMMRIRGVEFGFTRAWYHALGGVSFLTLTMDFNRLFKRTEVASQPITAPAPTEAAPAPTSN